MEQELQNEGIWKPSFNPWLIAIAVMLATFMEVLDTSVANVALPHIAGTFSATTDEATWVLTSYLVSNAIMIPTTAWLSNFLGRKKFLIICIILFTLASLLCGLANSLDMLIIARIIQGVGGGALQPISQAILLEGFPPQKRGVAMAVFGFGVVLAPIIGPSLGGWITDNFSWQWIFYINIPVGIWAVLMTNTVVEDPPYIKNSKQNKIGYVGFGFMAIWLATLQIVLDKGQQLEWFSSPFILIFAIISVLCMISFIIRELLTDEPIVDLSILKDRNFLVGTILITVLGAILYSTLALLPIFLQGLMGYTAQLSGLSISPRGIGSLLTIVVIGKIINKVDNRQLTALGFALLGIACFMLGNINLSISMENIIIPNIINGCALGLIFIPMSTLTFGTLKNEKIGNASGIYNLMRNIGGSIGISITNTLITHQAQIHQNYMVSHLNPYNPLFQSKIHAATAFFATKADPVMAFQQANGAIYGTLVKQAALWGFVDNFRIFAALSFFSIPLVFLFKKVAAKGSSPPVH